MRKLIKKLLPIYMINILKNLIPNKKSQLLKKLRFNYNNNIIFLGTDYGGWSFLSDNDLENKFIISAGLGEDASFDIELVSKYNCKVIIIDPTPRAVEHYKQIIKNAGKPKTEPYKKGGKQNISSYDLTHINNENFLLISNALYNVDNKELKFFSPPNKDHVSYSINNWQNDYKKSSDFIKIKTITIKSILTKYNISRLEMIKLDIEGAEIEVLKNMLDEKIFPTQILVEFDELNKINKIAIDRFEGVHHRLILENYKLSKTHSKFPDFLYIKH